MDFIVDFIGRNLVGVGATIGVPIVAWVLKKIPNDIIKAKFGKLMYGLGVTVTLGLSKWKYTKPIWNKYIEPWVIDAIDNILVGGIEQFVKGMQSDNQ